MYRLYGTKSNARRAGPAVLDDEANETQRASSSYWLRADSGKRFGGSKDENSALGPEYAQVLVAGQEVGLTPANYKITRELLACQSFSP